MNCKICHKSCRIAFEAKILNKYPVKYFHCVNCNFIQTEDPYWIKEAYQEALSALDTGLLKRNIGLSRFCSVLIYRHFDKTGKFLDFAGGSGAFTRLMRDVGFDFYWQDAFSENIFARGFEAEKTLTEKLELITAIECFEHLPNPLETIAEMLKKTDSVFLTTELLPEKVNPDWWYFGFEHGQHVSFFSAQALRLISEIFSVKYFTDGRRLHLFTKNPAKRINFDKLRLLIRLGMPSWIERKMMSRTMSDMKEISKRLS